MGSGNKPSDGDTTLGVCGRHGILGGLTINELILNTDKTKIVIFQKGGHGHKKKYPPFLYGDGKIEIVKDYIYLGIPFSESALFYQATQRAVSKSNIAVGSTVSIIHKLKRDSWRPIDKLYESLVNSTLLYGAQIWDLRYYEYLEKVHASFYKKTLHVASCTPNYALRIETGSPHIELEIFKLTLNWLEKLYDMTDERYPKICFKRLKELADRKESQERYNWALQVKTLFRKIGAEDVWNNLSAEMLESRKMYMIAAYKDLLYQNDVQRIQTSSSLRVYPHLMLNKGLQQYLKQRIPLNLLRVVTQVRLLNVYQTRISVKSKTIKLSEKQLCSCEERKPISDEYHVFIENKAFQEERRMYVSESHEVTTIKEDWLNLLNRVDLRSIKKIVHFVTRVLNRIEEL